MFFYKSLLIFILCVTVTCDIDSGWYIPAKGIVRTVVCIGSDDIYLKYHPGRSPEQENMYSLVVDKTFPAGSEVFINFDSDATVTLVSFQLILFIFEANPYFQDRRFLIWMLIFFTVVCSENLFLLCRVLLCSLVV